MSASKIRVLNDQTINKIAAGEVIENPASVVKELVENSLDAGSTSICVEIQAGGRELIRVSDDGIGMSSDDALLCLERHATSKIREVEDIQDLLTMGFRGEAIPSIAAISKFTLLTCPSQENGKPQKGEGTLIFVEGGQIVSCTAAPRSSGTTFEIKSLFFNVPVRRKFQKSPSFDSQEILKMLGLLALAHPSVQFELISDQKSLLKTPLSTQILSFHELLEKRLDIALGKEYATQLLPLKFQQTPYELEGFISAPLSHKPNRTGQHLFINQRLVYSPFISAAIREGYGTMLASQRYPLFVIHLRMPGSLLDVNVHPQKKEVRLRQEYQLKEMLMRGVQQALRGDQKSVEMPLSDRQSLSIPPFWGPYSSLLSSSKTPLTVQEQPWEFQPASPFNYAQLPEQPKNFPEKEKTIPAQESTATDSVNLSFFNPSTITAQESFFNAKTVASIPPILATVLGYCLIDPFHLSHSLFAHLQEKGEGGLLLLDQRAAYSRIYYDRLLQRSTTKESQSLLIPFTLQLTSAEIQTVQAYLPLLNEMGFGIREFGEQTLMVDTFPSFIKQDQLQTCLHLLIQDLMENQSSRRMQMQKEKKLAWAACQASIPSTKRLSIEEAQGLLKQLTLCEIPFQCPMGKPTFIYLAPHEIAKWFQKS